MGIKLDTVGYCGLVSKSPINKHMYTMDRAYIYSIA